MDEVDSDSDSNYDDYDKTESEEVVVHRNAITRSGRRIKASVSLISDEKAFKILIPTTHPHTSTPIGGAGVNTPSGNGGDVITLIISI